MGTDEHAILPLPKCKAQKLKIPLRVYAHYLALFHVHLELEFSLKVSSTGFKQAFPCSRCTGQHDDVVCVPNHMDAPDQQLLFDHNSMGQFHQLFRAMGLYSTVVILAQARWLPGECLCRG